MHVALTRRSATNDPEPAARRLDRLVSSLSSAWEPAWESPYKPGSKTLAGKITLPHQFSGWEHPVTLRHLLDVQRQGKDHSPATKLYFRYSYLLYRVSRRRPRKLLYIGMSKRGGVFRRVCAHYFGANKTLQRRLCPSGGRYSDHLHKELRAGGSLLSADNVLVQVGWIRSDSGQRVTNPGLKLLHAYELALQILERPKVYRRNVFTFDDFEEMRAVDI